MQGGFEREGPRGRFPPQIPIDRQAGSREGSPPSPFPRERRSWHERPHEELVGIFRNLIRQDIQHNEQSGGKALRYPARIISEELGHQEASHMSGTEVDRQRSAFYMPLNRAWYVIAYEHFRYRYQGQEYEDATSRHHAREFVSAEYQHAVAIGEPRPAFIKLDPQQVKILDALAEAAEIPHQRGQAEIEIPEHLRYCRQHRFSPDGKLIRVHHDLSYTVPSTTGGSAHVTLPRYSNPYHRGLRFDEFDRGRVCGSGATL